MRVLWIGLAVLVMASPASADLTAAEKAEVKKAYTATLSVETAMEKLADIVLEADADNRARIVTIWGSISGASGYYHWVQFATTKLLGFDPTPSTYCATCQASAFTNRTSAASALTTAQTNFNSLAGDAGESANVQTLAAAGSTALGVAIASLNDMDNGLAYATPMPATGTTSAASERAFGALDLTDFTQESSPFIVGPSRNVIGPHGDYILAMNDLDNAMTFFQQGLDGMKDTFDWNANGESAWASAELTAFSQVLKRSAALFTRFHHVMMALADIPIDATECGFSPTHLGARAMVHIMDKDVGTPFFFEAMSDEAFSPLFEAVMTRTNARTDFKPAWPRLTMTAWRYSDGVLWTGLEFPAKRVFTLRELRKQFRAETTSHVSPLCTDGTDPTITITAPTGGTVSGVITLTATASDNMAVRKVVWSVDGAQIGLAGSAQITVVPPHTIQWDSSSVANGARTLRATVTDMVGNTAFDEVGVTVAN